MSSADINIKEVTIGRLRELYVSEQLPVTQNRMFNSAQEARECPKGNMRLVQDMDTGLIFNQAFQEELLQYDQDYQNEQALSGVFRVHLARVSMLIHEHLTGSGLIEIGCGKGYFLECLESQGFDIIGLDPAYEGDNPSIVKKLFTADLGICADGIILRHVLEHVSDPVEFLAKICAANGGKGKIYIEVPCFDWICEQRAWFDIFYEHVNYFRLEDFSRMFGCVYASGHVFAGQYIYVVADLATLRQPKYLPLDPFCFPADFLGRIGELAISLQEQVATVIWGGASKGVIFSLFMQRLGVDIDFVVDINPAKQGKYLAASGLRVCSPEEALPMLSAMTNIYIMNGNYIDEVAGLVGDGFNLIAVDG